MGWWEAMRGRERARQEVDEAARRTRETQEKAQEAALERGAGQGHLKQPEAVQRAENEPRPAERIWPDYAERMRAMHDNPPAPQKPEQEREATRMEHTRTAQPVPSMGGPGVRFTNSRVQHPKDWADQLLEEAKAKVAAEKEQERDRGGRKSIWADDMREAERQAAIERSREPEQELERDLSRPMERERGSRTRWN